MNYHIPSNDEIKEVLKDVLSKFRTVQSQNKLKDLVIKELNKKKKKFGLTGNRLRNIAINSDFIKLEIHTREGDPDKIMVRCPVCRGNLKRDFCQYQKAFSHIYTYIY